jgi:hypothetical protein
MRPGGHKHTSDVCNAVAPGPIPAGCRAGGAAGQPACCGKRNGSVAAVGCERTFRGGTRETQTVAGDQSLIGSIGVVIVATRGEAGPGEVLLKIRGGTEAYLAWSINPIPKGATVLVVESRGARTVDVSEWADPLDIFSDNPH